MEPLKMEPLKMEPLMKEPLMKELRTSCVFRSPLPP